MLTSLATTTQADSPWNKSGLHVMTMDSSLPSPNACRSISVAAAANASSLENHRLRGPFLAEQQLVPEVDTERLSALPGSIDGHDDIDNEMYSPNAAWGAARSKKIKGDSEERFVSRISSPIMRLFGDDGFVPSITNEHGSAVLEDDEDEDEVVHTLASTFPSVCQLGTCAGRSLTGEPSPSLAGRSTLRHVGDVASPQAVVRDDKLVGDESSLRGGGSCRIFLDRAEPESEMSVVAGRNLTAAPTTTKTFATTRALVASRPNIGAGEEKADESGFHGSEGCEPERPFWRVDVDLSLQCTRGRLWGCSDVIGTIDFDAAGENLATGGISRKIRVYSLAQLKAHKERKLESWRDNARHGGEGHSGEEEYSSYAIPAGKKCRRRRTASTSDLRGLYNREEKAESAGEEQAGGPAFSCVLDTDQSAAKIICCAAKLSSVQWVPRSAAAGAARIGAGDYDGVFAEWDVEKGMCVSERDEHGGQRIWSIDYSEDAPGAAAGRPVAVSASDDGTVRLWAGDSEDSISAIACPSGKLAVCSAKFGPVGAGGGNLIALGGADAMVYLYDLRNIAEPLLALAGHRRTVSYVRFMGGNSLVSSSVDSTVKVWDISGSNPSAAPSSSSRLSLSCSKHVNVRNFVGLSVGGPSSAGSGAGSRGTGSGSLVATGSENNELVLYHVNSQSRLSSTLKFDFGCARPPVPHGRAKSPMLGCGVSETTSSSGGAGAESGSEARRGVPGPFVSAVSWQEKGEGNMLAAANSQGMVRILRAYCTQGRKVVSTP